MRVAHRDLAVGQAKCERGNMRRRSLRRLTGRACTTALVGWDSGPARGNDTREGNCRPKLP